MEEFWPLRPVRVTAHGIRFHDSGEGRNAHATESACGHPHRYGQLIKRTPSPAAHARYHMISIVLLCEPETLPYCNSFHVAHVSVHYYWTLHSYQQFSRPFNYS